MYALLTSVGVSSANLMVRQHRIKRILSPPLRPPQGLPQSAFVNKNRFNLILISCFLENLFVIAFQLARDNRLIKALRKLQTFLDHQQTPGFIR
jgi:hypothetical protein